MPKRELSAPTDSNTARWSPHARWNAALVAAIGGGLVLAYPGVLRGQALAGRDLLRIAISDSSFLRRCLSQGSLPLWNPLLRMGQPFAATLQSQAFYAPRVISVALFSSALAPTVEQLFNAVLATLGMFFAVRGLRGSRAGALVAGACFGLAPLFTWLGLQLNVSSAAAWTGWIVCAAIPLSRRPTASRTAALAATIGASLLAGSPETTLWQLVLVCALLAASSQRRSTWLGALAVGWGFALAAIALAPGAELAVHSVRAVNTTGILDWSLSPWQLVGAFIPGAEQPIDPTGKRDQFFLLSELIGSLPFALAVLGATRWRRTWPISACAVIFTLLALGEHFAPARWLILHSPLRAFRYPVKAFVGTAACVAMLAGIGVDRLAALAAKIGRSTLIAWAFALAAVVVGLVLPAPLRALGARPFIGDGLRWFSGFVGATALIVFTAPSMNRRWAFVRIAAVVATLLELAIAQWRQAPLPWVNAARLEQPSRLASLLPASYLGRVSVEPFDHWTLELPYGQSAQSYLEHSRDSLEYNRSMEDGVALVEGYGAPEPERNDLFIDYGGRGAYDLGGTAYFTRWSGAPFPDAKPVLVEPPLAGLYRTDTAMPRVFMVQRSSVRGDRETVEAISRQEFRDRVFFPSGTPVERPPCTSSPSRWSEPSPNALMIDVDACDDGYAVVTDSYYPGWSATIDGAPTQILRADFVARAVPITRGKHHIEMTYRPWSFFIGALVSLLGLLGLAAARKQVSRVLFPNTGSIIRSSLSKDPSTALRSAQDDER